MAEWPFVDHDWLPDWSGPYPCDPYKYGTAYYYQEKAPPLPPMSESFPPQAQEFMSPPLSPRRNMLPAPTGISPILPTPQYDYTPAPIIKGENPRELRNKAEKQRRDKLNKSIEKLASMVPPVVNINKKFDKTSVLRFTAHYLRAHQYVFGDAINKSAEKQVQELNASGARAVLGFLNGFLLTTTYRGLVVVVSQNVQQHLGYTEVDLIGQSIFKIIHPDDIQTVKEQLTPPTHFLGPHGELLAPKEPLERQKIFDALQNEIKKFTARFKKFGQKSEPPQYVSCVVEGSMRKSDAACRGVNRCCQMVRRARARGDNPYASGNDIVFIGVVHPMCETFISERQMESFKMEYRTRHSVDGEIIQCEQRIALVTGYMSHEVNGINAMTLMHREDVRWVIIALRQMYDENILVGESCYRLMAKNGQFIYMRTRGKLDVEDESRAVRTFVCTNTVVEEREGKHLIKMMKKKFQCMINCSDAVIEDEDKKEDELSGREVHPLSPKLCIDSSHTEPSLLTVTRLHSQAANNLVVPVENPRNLEKVILHLVTNLPSPQPEPIGSESPKRGCSPSLPLAIIPPKRERILGAIEKIYSVITTLNNNMSNETKNSNVDSLININEDLSNDVFEINLNDTDFESILTAPPLEPIASMLTDEDLKILNNNNVIYNEMNGKAQLEELKTYNPSQPPLEINMDLEYGPDLPSDPTMMSQPAYAYDQPGPSGLGVKRPHDHEDDQNDSKKLARINHQVHSKIIDLNDSSSENEEGNISLTSTRKMAAAVQQIEMGEVSATSKINPDDESEDEGFQGLLESERDFFDRYIEDENFSMFDTDDSD